MSQPPTAAAPPDPDAPDPLTQYCFENYPKKHLSFHAIEGPLPTYGTDDREPPLYEDQHFCDGFHEDGGYEPVWQWCSHCISVPKPAWYGNVPWHGGLVRAGHGLSITDPEHRGNQWSVLRDELIHHKYDICPECMGSGGGWLCSVCDEMDIYPEPFSHRIQEAVVYALSDDCSLSIPGMASNRHKDLTRKERESDHGCRVIGGDRGDLLFDGYWYDYEDDRTVLCNPRVRTTLFFDEDADDDMDVLFDLAEGILQYSFDALGHEAIEHS